jgi:hypothetical protein
LTTCSWGVDAFLAELGYSAQEIATLRDAKAI